MRLFLYNYGERAWTAGLTFMWQQRCMSYTQPADRVAYVAGPAGLELPGYLADFSATPGMMWNGTVGAMPYPIELAELQKRIYPQSVTAWEALPAPIFLHGLKDAQGRTRLVAVYALANSPGGWWTMLATVRDPLPLDPMDMPTQAAQAFVSTSCWPLRVEPSTKMVVYAGQADARDPSRFTVRVRLAGNEQILTGVLQDDGSVKFISTTGLAAWSADRVGPLVLPSTSMPPPPAPVTQPFESCRGGILLPSDDQTW